MIEVDRPTIIQIFGALMKAPNLLSDIDKYQLDMESFNRPLDRFIFSAIYNLYVNGAERITTVDIVNYLTPNTYASNLIEKENGIVFLQDCETLVEKSNFDYYYNKFKKINLVRELQLAKNDVDKIYSDDPLRDDSQVINANFEKMSSQDILNLFKGKLEVLEKRYVINNVVEESSPAASIRQKLKDWKKEPEVGCRLQGDIFNTITRGGRRGKLYLRSGGSGVGKAVPNYTKIPTPNGWTTVGEVKAGDYLFDRFGRPTKVLAVYPQEEKKEIYKVYFKSGKIAECCEEHLWSYYNNSSRNNKLITKTTKELMKLKQEKELKNKKGAYRYSIPLNKAVQYGEKKYSISPYAMGLLLGDGSFRYTPNRCQTFYYAEKGEELAQILANELGYILRKKDKWHPNSWTFEFSEEDKSLFKHSIVQVPDLLKDYPELLNKSSYDKFIPEAYLFGSIKQRKDLLRGLLDTDGSAEKKTGRITFSTTSKFLKDDFIQLCYSLGYTVSIIEDKREQYTTGIAYRLTIHCNKIEKEQLFSYTPKKQIILDYLNSSKEKKEIDMTKDPIINIEATGQYTEMTCFYVDNEEHLFLMNDMIVTHNTRSLVGDACNIAYPERYNPQTGEWIQNPSTEKVLYIMTEQDTEEIDTMIMAYLTGYNEEVFTYGTFDEDDPIIQRAIEIMEQNSDNMNYARIPDPSSSVVKNLIRRRFLQDEIEYYFYDYIFSSPAMLNEYRDLGIREDRLK